MFPICDALLTGPLRTHPACSRAILALGALFPRGRPVQDLVLTHNDRRLAARLTTEEVDSGLTMEEVDFGWWVGTADVCRGSWVEALPAGLLL